MIEPVGAPERLAVYDDIRRAEHAARDRGVHFASQSILQCGIVESARQAGLVHPEGGGNLRDYVGVRNVAIVNEVSLIERERKLSRKRRVLIRNEVKSAAGARRGNRKFRRNLERQTVESRGTIE